MEHVKHVNTIWYGMPLLKNAFWIVQQTPFTTLHIKLVYVMMGIMWLDRHVIYVQVKWCMTLLPEAVNKVKYALEQIKCIT